jgi:uncharacterized protein (TIGR00106 family)
LENSHSIIADFSIVPVGHGETSVGKYVAAVVKALKNIKGLETEVTPMGTILASNNIATILEAVRISHETIIAMGVQRVLSTLRIDERRDKQRTMNDKIKAIEEYMKKEYIEKI